MNLTATVAVIAQMQGVSPESLSAVLNTAAWLVGVLVGVMTLVFLGIQIFHALKGKPKHSEECPTREEMEKADTANRNASDTADRELRNDLAGHKESTRTKFHEIADRLHDMNVKMAAQPVQLQQMVNEAVKPLTAKVDQLYFALAKRFGFTTDEKS